VGVETLGASCWGLVDPGVDPDPWEPKMRSLGLLEAMRIERGSPAFRGHRGR